MKNGLSRRRFIFATGAGGAALLSAGFMAGANAAGEMVDPSSPQAVALGYVTDGASVDTEKFKRYEAGQECANCQLYQGSADSESAACLLFAGQAVAAKGWCNSWVKKAS